MSKTHLITSAIGNQGEALINALLDSSEVPKTSPSLTRNIHSSAATALEANPSAMTLIEGPQINLVW
jgi:hypothetical protein